VTGYASVKGVAVPEVEVEELLDIMYSSGLVEGEEV